MKYVVIDQTKTDWFTSEYATKEEAIQACKDDFGRLTTTDRNKRVAFYVLESVNPDEDADNHLDGDVIYNAM